VKRHGCGKLRHWQKPKCAAGSVLLGSRRIGRPVLGEWQLAGLASGRWGCAVQTWRWKFSLMAATAVAAAVAFMVSARSDDFLRIVAARQTAMKALSHNLSVVADYTEAKADRAAAVTAATLLLTTAKNLPSLFPPGTDAIALPGQTAANPEIWSNPDSFALHAAQLVAVAQKLLDAVETDDPAKARAGLDAADREGCESCHAAFWVRI
jgi:cytochrome c556